MSKNKRKSKASHVTSAAATPEQLARRLGLRSSNAATAHGASKYVRTTKYRTDYRYEE